MLFCDSPNCHACIDDSPLGRFAQTEEIRAYAAELGWHYKDYIDSCPNCRRQDSAPDSLAPGEDDE